MVDLDRLFDFANSFAWVWVFGFCFGALRLVALRVLGVILTLRLGVVL